jgi:transposase
LGSNLPLKVARLNPAGIKHYSKAALNRNVTDALSARYIAQYLIAQNHKIDYSPQNRYYSSFRSLHTNINLLKSQRVQLINELKMLLYTAFPELTRYCKTGIADWVLELLPNQS